MLPVLPAAALKGGGYHNDMHISVSHLGERSDCVADQFKMKEDQCAVTEPLLSFSFFVSGSRSCQHSHLMGLVC